MAWLEIFFMVYGNDKKCHFLISSSIFLPITLFSLGKKQIDVARIKPRSSYTPLSVTPSLPGKLSNEKPLVWELMLLQHRSLFRILRISIRDVTKPPKGRSGTWAGNVEICSAGRPTYPYLSWLYCFVDLDRTVKKVLTLVSSNKKIVYFLSIFVSKAKCWAVLNRNTWPD